MAARANYGSAGRRLRASLVLGPYGSQSPRGTGKSLVTWSLPLAVLTALTLAGCSSRSGPKPPQPQEISQPEPPPRPAPPSPPTALPPPPGPVVIPPPPEVLPEEFASNEWVVTVAKPADTAASLAARHLGSSSKAWMIEDFADGRPIAPGREVVIPKREWNLPGVYPSGYQLVPVLVYHNIAVERKGRLVIGAKTFEEQMRALKADGFHAVRLEEFLAFLQHARQLPKKSVLLTFDDGHKAFVEYARPLLKELGFSAVLFVQTDQISSKANPNFLSWTELRDLEAEGFEVQTHSKTHRDLRRQSSESDAAYGRRMQLELQTPLELFRKNLPGPVSHLETVAYPFGAWDEALLRQVKQYGYAAGFTVQREGNPAFVSLLKINRSQVYADWTLDEFRKTLTVFHRQPILPEEAATEVPSTGRGDVLTRAQLAAPHNERAASLESKGLFRQSLEESQIALTINPNDTAARERQDRLAGRIESAVAAQLQEAQKLARASAPDANRRFLAALALDPASRAAFDALRDTRPATRFLTHTVKANDTTASLANLYYGDRARADAIEEANGLQPGAALSVGTSLKIPEIPGYSLLRPDR